MKSNRFLFPLLLLSSLFLGTIAQAQIDFSTIEPYRGYRGDSGNSSASRDSDSEEDRQISRGNAQNRLGRAAMQSGDFQAALRYFQAANNIDPDSVYEDNIALARSAIVNQQGIDAYNNKDYATALIYFQQALSSRPNSTTYKHNIGLARTEITIQNANAQNDEGCRLLKNGDYQGALAHFRKANEISPYKGFAANIEMAEEKLKREEGKSRDLTVAVELNRSMRKLGQSWAASPPSTGQGFFGTTVAHPNDLMFGDPTATTQMNTSAADQATGINANIPATQSPNLEIKSHSAQGGFDTPVAPGGQLVAVTRDGGDPAKEPMIPAPLAKDAIIAEAVQKRDEDRKILEAADVALKSLQQANPQDTVAIAKVKQESTTAANQVSYDNFSISNRIRALSSASSAAGNK